MREMGVEQIGSGQTHHDRCGTSKASDARACLENPR
jgi:hypothetical protein